jgi:hypothetical protein
MRFRLRSITIVLVGASLATAQQKPLNDLVTEHRAAARQALTAKDYEGYRKHLLVLRQLLNNQVELTHSLATADALLGNSQLAIEELNQYAATGFIHDPANDPRFASLVKLPAFSQVARTLQANGRPISAAMSSSPFPIRI